jgi:hypothetical protein
VDAETRKEVDLLLHQVTDVRHGYDLGPKVLSLAKAVRILADTVLGPGEPEAPVEATPDAASEAGLFR